jgi:peptidase inhibitor family I36
MSRSFHRLVRIFLSRVALMGVLLAGALALTAAPASAVTTCPSGFVCVWPQPDYGGDRFAAVCQTIQVFSGFTIRSAKNHCANQRVRFFNSTGEVRCLNPGEERPGPFPDGTRTFIIDGLRC